ncbi:hypothetical protein ACM66B_004183 [Microbotryomycetes sp. NB124-2]
MSTTASSYAASLFSNGPVAFVDQFDMPPRLLTIAGSDSGGGAGIQADLKTFSAFETYGMSVITAVTAQDTVGVHQVEGLSPAIVAKQLDCVINDIGCDAIKTGMLYSADTITAIVRVLERAYSNRHSSNSSSIPRPNAPPLVIDPVCVSTSGHSLLPVEALSSLKQDLMPWATVITPNVPEAELLAGWDKGSIKSVDDMVRCAELLGNLGARWVYLKGGHLPLANGVAASADDKIVTDILWDAQTRTSTASERRFLEIKNTHGTGCTLSAAIASLLAKGHSVPDAVKTAADYVATAIATSFPLGQGSGPVNHFHQTIQRSLPAPTLSSPTPFTDFLINYDIESWRAYVTHPFPTGLAKGTIPLESFLHFIKQDYHFLKQYARTNALAVYKTLDLKEMQASSEIVQTVIKETEMHVKYCEKYGISREQLQLVPESVTNVAYTRYVLDVSSKGDLLDNKVVTAPCLIGYGQVGYTLLNSSEVNKDSCSNPFWSWIEEYGSDWFQQAVRTGIQSLEESVKESPISQQRLIELAQVFQQATKLEIAFWDEAVAAVSKSKT